MPYFFLIILVILLFGALIILSLILARMRAIVKFQEKNLSLYREIFELMNNNIQQKDTPVKNLNLDEAS